MGDSARMTRSNRFVEHLDDLVGREAALPSAPWIKHQGLYVTNDFSVRFGITVTDVNGVDHELCSEDVWFDPDAEETDAVEHVMCAFDAPDDSALYWEIIERLKKAELIDAAYGEPEED